MALTDRELRALKPADKAYKRADSGGLFALVHPNGSIYFRIKYRWQGAEQTYAAGVYGHERGEVSLAEARKTCDWLHECLERGVDPRAVRRDAESAAHLKAKNTVEVVARLWHSKQGKWSEKYTTRVLRRLKRDCFPIIGDKPIAGILAPDVLMCVRRVEARAAYGEASRLLGHLEAICGFAVAQGMAPVNAAAGLEKALHQVDAGEFSWMDRQAFAAFLRKLPDAGGRPATRLALELVYLTMLRPGEVAGLEWQEVDLDNKLLRIRAERMKMREEHLVPLSRQALAVLERVRPFSGERYVFPNYRQGDVKPISENCLLYALYDLGYKGKATVHGFRKTASTLLNEMQYEPDWIERQLAHSTRGVRGVYNKAQYLPQRASMLQSWADFCDSLRDGAKIIPIGGRAA